jgi:hypothetical protein
MKRSEINNAIREASAPLKGTNGIFHPTPNGM